MDCYDLSEVDLFDFITARFIIPETEKVLIRHVKTVEITVGPKIPLEPIKQAGVDKWRAVIARNYWESQGIVVFCPGVITMSICGLAAEYYNKERTDNYMEDFLDGLNIRYDKIINGVALKNNAVISGCKPLENRIGFYVTVEVDDSIMKDIIGFGCAEQTFTGLNEIGGPFEFHKVKEAMKKSAERVYNVTLTDRSVTDLQAEIAESRGLFTSQEWINEGIY